MSDKTTLNQGTIEFLDSLDNRLGLIIPTLNNIEFSGSDLIGKEDIILTPGINGTAQLTVADKLDISADTSTGNTSITSTSDISFNLSGDLLFDITGDLNVTTINGDIRLFTTSGINRLTSTTNIHLDTPELIIRKNNDTIPDTTPTILTMASDQSGMILPRMTTAQRTSIASPAEGLMVYDTDENTISLRSNSTWTNMQYKSEVVMRVALFALSVPGSTEVTITTQYSAVGAIEKGLSIDRTTGVITLNPPITATQIVASFNLLIQGVSGTLDGFAIISKSGGGGVGIAARDVGFRYSRPSGGRSESTLNGSIFFNYEDDIADRQLLISLRSRNSTPFDINGNFSLIFFYSI